MKGTKSREQLFYWISMVSFVLIDLNQYLDTHPYDANALNCYQQYQGIYQKAYEEYTSCYGPLQMTQNNAENKWNWSLEKNPWERGYV